MENPSMRVASSSEHLSPDNQHGVNPRPNSANENLDRGPWVAIRGTSFGRRSWGIETLDASAAIEDDPAIIYPSPHLSEDCVKSICEKYNSVVTALTQSPANGRETEDWSEICTRPDSNDLMWFCRGDTYDGPREPQYDDADYWDYWCYARPPSLPSADKTAVNEARWKDVEPLDECSLPEFEDHEFRRVAPNTPESAGPKSEGKPFGYLFQPHGATVWDFSETRPDISQGAYWTVVPVYKHPSPAVPGAGVRDVWPSGCHSPGSCTRHKQCMYVNCRYEGTDIKDAILSALSDRAGAEDRSTHEA